MIKKYFSVNVAYLHRKLKSATRDIKTAAIWFSFSRQQNDVMSPGVKTND